MIELVRGGEVEEEVSREDGEEDGFMGKNSLEGKAEKMD